MLLKSRRKDRSKKDSGEAEAGDNVPQSYKMTLHSGIKAMEDS